MAIYGFELEEIARLIALVDTRALEELVIEETERSIRIRGPHRPGATRTAETTSPSHSLPERTERARPKAAIAPPAAPTPLPEDQVVLVAPMVGIFYRAERPGAPPLIQVGDQISVDQTVGIIEAMKVFSEFKSEYAGTVIAIPGQDGQLVQNGAPLFVLKKG